MKSIEKFISDIERIKKRERASSGGRYDGKRACGEIVRLFEGNNRAVAGVSRQIADYWLGTYALGAADPSAEPSEENVARLRAFQAFLDNDADEDVSVLSADDWENLRDFVSFEAESMDIGQLEAMMSMILDHGGL